MVTVKEQAAFYDTFLDHFIQQQFNDRNVSFRDWLRKWISSDKGTKVLDVGCAYGYNTAWLQHDFGAMVAGVDLSPKCIKAAKERYPECYWFAGDITDSSAAVIPEELTEFNAIVMSDVIEHVPLNKHLDLFNNLSRLCKLGGFIIGSVPSFEYYEEIKKTTVQPVEEKVLLGELFSTLYISGFRRVHSLFLYDQIYYRFVVQKTIELVDLIPKEFIDAIGNS